MRQATNTADTYFQKASPPSCALRCCMSNSNDAHKSRRVPRSTAASPTMYVDHLAGTPRWRRPVPSSSIVSAPQQRLSLASTALERESRQITRLCNSRERRGAAACSHESRRRIFAAARRALRAYLAPNLAHAVAKDLVASFSCLFALVDAPVACEKAQRSWPL